MRKLFYENTHILDFNATVTEVAPDEKGRGIWLLLDRTAFFPEEGGQAADKGTIDGYAVIDVQIKNDLIYHLISSPDMNLPTSIVFLPGQVVSGHVDWEQRFDFMQQHSGEHIISGLLHSHFGFHNVGFHLGATEVTMDFDQVISLEQLREIEKEANEIIWKNLPVHASFPPKEDLASLNYRSKIEIDGPVRIVEIPGVDICACCAPHVDRTGEIGMIKITNVQSHRGGVRINILCGSRALADYTTKQDTSSSLCTLLSSKPEKLTDNVKRVMDEALIRKQKADGLAEQLLQMQIAALPAPNVNPHPLLFIELDNNIAIRNAVNGLCEHYPGFCSIFSGNDVTGYHFIIGSSTKDCREAAGLLRNTLGAKGGGTAPMVQGSVAASADNIQELFMKFCEAL